MKTLLYTLLYLVCTVICIISLIVIGYCIYKSSPKSQMIVGYSIIAILILAMCYNEASKQVKKNKT